MRKICGGETMISWACQSPGRIISQKNDDSLEPCEGDGRNNYPLNVIIHFLSQKHCPSFGFVTLQSAGIPESPPKRASPFLSFIPSMFCSLVLWAFPFLRNLSLQPFSHCRFLLTRLSLLLFSISLISQLPRGTAGLSHNRE